MFLDVCAVPSLSWKEEWKLSFLKVKLSTRLRSGRTTADVGCLRYQELGPGGFLWELMSPGAKARSCCFGQPRFPPRLKSGYSTPWLGLSQPQTDSMGLGPCISFMHFDFKVWRSSILESMAGRRGGGERRKCQHLAHGGLRPTESRPGAAPWPPASWEHSQ